MVEVGHGDEDLSGAVEVADGVWWVGTHLADDPFQCHAYLIEHGDDCVLIDPGGPLTVEAVWDKVATVVDPGRVRWIVCHHQDPDVAGALPWLSQRMTRPDAAVVTHWRAAALLKHYGTSLPFHLVDQNDWELDLGGRRLQFVFTPYLHFPGAFTTFDELTGTLFSSDLFGGFSTEPRLFADDLGYFEAMRPFHEHYMPSREILRHGLGSLSALPLRLIAPQHGHLIPEDLIAPIIEQLSELDCGLYLLVERDTDIARLSAMQELLRDLVAQMAESRHFRDTAETLERSARAVLPLRALEFYAVDEGGQGLHFSDACSFHGHPQPIPEGLRRLLDADRPAKPRDLPWVGSEGPDPYLAVALFAPNLDRPNGIAVLRLDRPVGVHESTLVALSMLSTPLEVALEREMLLRAAEAEQERLYGLATHDPLTGMYNRRALDEPVRHLLDAQDAGGAVSVVVTVIDLDHFKDINDQHGHAVGDEVLARVGDALRSTVRSQDLAARIGGEEFVVVGTHRIGATPTELANRVRAAIGAVRVQDADIVVTASIGVAERTPGEPFADVLARADRALYDAKHAGRDCVALAPPP